MKKRFTNEGQILKKIDWCYQKHAEMLSEALTREKWARDILNSPSQVDRENAVHELEEVKRLRDQAQALIDSRAKKLGRRLAEFRTAILPGVVEDESMPVKLGK